MAYGKKLTAEEIAIRMVELRNLRVAHKHDRKQIKELRAEVKQLKNEKAEDSLYTGVPTTKIGITSSRILMH